MSLPLRPVMNLNRVHQFPLAQKYDTSTYIDQKLLATEGSLQLNEMSTENISNSTFPASFIQEETFCKWILYRDVVADSRVRIWDLIILIPNVLFFIFLLVRFNRTRLKLRSTSSPIFSTFYGLVVMTTVISLIRCGVAMCVNAAVPAGDIADKVLWVAVRFFMFATEMSVVIFGLAFGHLDSKTSIRRVLVVTSFISLAYSISQGALEILTPEESFRVIYTHYDVFAHGGMLFLFISSCLFLLVYGLIFISPWTSLRDRLALPSKKSFYYYALFLSLLNAIQAIGSGMLFFKQSNGFCLIDTTTYVYFTCFSPLVYRTFLNEFFSVVQPNILFSYKPQVDDDLPEPEDSVSLPHQLSCSSLKTDSDYIYQNNSLYESTHFDYSSVNPLYVHSLQSPDSVLTFDGTVSINSSVESPPAAAPSSNSAVNGFSSTEIER